MKCKVCVECLPTNARFRVNSFERMTTKRGLCKRHCCSVLRRRNYGRRRNKYKINVNLGQRIHNIETIRSSGANDAYRSFPLMASVDRDLRVGRVFGVSRMGHTASLADLGYHSAVQRMFQVLPTYNAMSHLPSNSPLRRLPLGLLRPTRGQCAPGRSSVPANRRQPKLFKPPM